MELVPSIMPGKINPVIPEFLIQLCFQVIGHNAACQACLDHGELDLNIWESTMVFNILESMDLLRKGIDVFTSKCIHTFQVNKKKNQENITSIIPLLTRLMQKHGYSTINAICKDAPNNPTKLKEILRKKGFLE